MKIDHIVVHIDETHQNDQTIIGQIRDAGFAYDPRRGKGNRGFGVSNMWIGDEYLELVRLKNETGGGRTPAWVDLYNQGHRGVVCLMLDVDDIDAIYVRLQQADLQISSPERLSFKRFFGLLTRRMPWRNAYVAPFSYGMQIGFQQMKDEKTRSYMQAYMEPNSRAMGVTCIQAVELYGPYTPADKQTIHAIFPMAEEMTDRISVTIDGGQVVSFVDADTVYSRVVCQSERSDVVGNEVAIENMRVHIAGEG